MDNYLGEIRMVGFNFAPANWALCNGQMMAINQNTALYSLLGTYYGGNGTTSFALPNLQGRVPVHAGLGLGLSPYYIGQMDGAETATLTTQQMPAHLHTLTPPVSSNAADQTDPTGAISAVINAGTGRGAATYPGYTKNAPTGVGAQEQTAIMGGSQPHTNLQPYLCVNFVIALVGLYPIRN